MSTLGVVLIVVAAVLVMLLVGGIVATRRRSASQASDYSEHVATADRALQEARAADKGWDRAVLEAAARSALSERRPDFAYEDLHLVLVDDRPGIAEDRAHFAAVGDRGETRVVLVRREAGWHPERVD